MTAEPFPSNQPKKPTAPPAVSGPARIWADLVHAGWGEAVLRYATHGLLLLGLVLLVLAQQFNLGFVDQWIAKASLQSGAGSTPVAGLAVVTPTPNPLDALEVIGALPAGTPEPTATSSGVIERLADPYTLIPTRGRSAVITYTVKAGDTLFGIADNFGLQPETLLWGNYFVLKDDP